MTGGDGQDRRLLLADDDETFCQVLATALERRGFAVTTAHDGLKALESARAIRPAYALVDLRMPGCSGLDLVAGLHALDPDMRILVLTGYASIATAVEAVKRGAVQYLTKPADADEVVAALDAAAGDPPAEVPARPMSLDRLEWEHIQRVLEDAGGNVSEAARRLGIHRRTLQRKLFKRPARR